jgi:hypothetical protein
VPCKSSLNIKGEHFPCDWPTDANGKHDGWAHTNKAAQAVWGEPATLKASGVSR